MLKPRPCWSSGNRAQATDPRTKQAGPARRKPHRPRSTHAGAHARDAQAPCGAVPGQFSEISAARLLVSWMRSMSAPTHCSFFSIFS